MQQGGAAGICKASTHIEGGAAGSESSTHQQGEAAPSANVNETSLAADDQVAPQAKVKAKLSKRGRKHNKIGKASEEVKKQPLELQVIEVVDEWDAEPYPQDW